MKTKYPLTSSKIRYYKSEKFNQIDFYCADRSKIADITLDVDLDLQFTKTIKKQRTETEKAIEDLRLEKAEFERILQSFPSKKELFLPHFKEIESSSLKLLSRLRVIDKLLEGN